MASESDVEPLAYCDWIVNVNGCPDSGVHRAFKIASLALSAVAVLLSAAYLLLRRATGQRFWYRYGPGAIDGSFALICVSFVFRTVDAALISFDAYPNYVARYVVSELGWIIVFHALVYFLFAIVHSIPNAYLDVRGRMRNTLLPPRWLFLAVCLFEVVGSLVANEVLCVLSGIYFERGGLGAVVDINVAHFTCWAVFVGVMAVAFWFYCSRLIIIIRDNYVNAGRAQSETMKRSIQRLKMIIFTVAPGLVIFALGLIMLAAFRVKIFLNLGASLFFSFNWNMLTQLLAIVATPVLIYIELYGETEETEKTGSSHDKRRGTSSRVKSDESNEPSAMLRDALVSLSEMDAHHQPLSLRVLDL